MLDDPGASFFLVRRKSIPFGEQHDQNKCSALKPSGAARFAITFTSLDMERKGKPACVPSRIMTAAPVAASASGRGLPHPRDLSDKVRKAGPKRVVAPRRRLSLLKDSSRCRAAPARATSWLNRDSCPTFKPNLTFEEEGDLQARQRPCIRKLWVSSPSSTQALTGRARCSMPEPCQSLHYPRTVAAIRRKGRRKRHRCSLRRRTEPARPTRSARRSKITGCLAAPTPLWRSAFRTLRAGPAVRGKMVIVYQEQPVELGDGTRISLRLPRTASPILATGRSTLETTLSPRMTPR